MAIYRTHETPAGTPPGDRPAVTVVARISERERASLAGVARDNDRTTSREVRRAVRYYLIDPQAADEALRLLAERERES